MVTTIAHLSDLRFGAITDELLEGIRIDLGVLAPDLVVVSGDLTKRASKDQFIAAREFLESLPAPHLAVPGVRDVERLNLIKRWFAPLQGWLANVANDLEPFFSNADVCVLGIDTSRSGGRKKLTTAQASVIRTKLGTCDQVTVLVTHHPLVARPASGTTNVAIAESKELRVIGKCVDVVLAGHQAIGSPQDTRVAYRVLDRQTIVAQAGVSPIPSGVRDTSPYYNAVRIDGDRTSVAVRLWRGDHFEEQGPKSYRYGGSYWDKFVDMPSDFQWSDNP